MPTINQQLSGVREILLSPKDQAPNPKQAFGALLRETQNFINELSNSHVAWTYGETTVNLGSASGDYAVTENNSIGKILFVTTQSPNQNYFYPVEFTNLADASSNWWSYYPVIPDASNAFAPYAAFPMQVAFYRQNGQLRVRVGANVAASGQLKIVYSAGDWTANVDPGQSVVLTQFRDLVECRAAKRILEACEWRDEAFDAQRKRNLAASLSEAEARVYAQFVIHKRSPNADQATTRMSWGNQGYEDLRR